jgi:hypothetical protein
MAYTASARNTLMEVGATFDGLCLDKEYCLRNIERSRNIGSGILPREYRLQGILRSRNIALKEYRLGNIASGMLVILGPERWLQNVGSGMLAQEYWRGVDRGVFSQSVGNHYRVARRAFRRRSRASNRRSLRVPRLIRRAGSQRFRCL